MSFGKSRDDAAAPRPSFGVTFVMTGSKTALAPAPGITDRAEVRTEASDWIVRSEAIRIGEDLLVCIFGGEKPHIGAVAAAQPRPSLADPARTSATASVLAYVGHKEDALAKTVAERLAALIGVRVVVTAGIHWDNLDKAGIATVDARCEEILNKLAARFRPSLPSGPTRAPGSKV